MARGGPEGLLRNTNETPSPETANETEGFGILVISLRTSCYKPVTTLFLLLILRGLGNAGSSVIGLNSDIF